MTMIEYEWDVEVVSYYHDGVNDILDHLFQDNFKGCLKEVAEMDAEALEDYKNTSPYSDKIKTVRCEIVLVRTDWSAGGPRSWAYLKEDGTLPEFFAQAYGDNCGKVRKRFHTYVAKAMATAK